MYTRAVHYLLISNFLKKMKNLNGMKSFSSLENKKLDLNSSTAVLGSLEAGPKYIASNFLNENGCRDVDYYHGGKWRARFYDCSGC
ncbi:TIGR04139 family peptide modification target [Sphingobacterium spiritivorum]